jgi:hypothetical protein
LEVDSVYLVVLGDGFETVVLEVDAVGQIIMEFTVSHL